MANYRVLKGIDYPPNKRVEAGQTVSDLPPTAISWLLEHNIIEDASKPAKKIEEPKIEIVVDEETEEPTIEEIVDVEEPTTEIISKEPEVLTVEETKETEEILDIEELLEIKKDKKTLIDEDIE
jgi:hypothetical protein